jgi:hypothetical protein
MIGVKKKTKTSELHYLGRPAEQSPTVTKTISDSAMFILFTLPR